MSIPYSNRLVTLGASNRLCKAFGVKISSNIQIAQFAANAGFDALFIDLEHGWLSHEQAQALCTVALLTGISPLVRVPHQCGNGFVQRVLDGGAMGVIFPHIHSLGLCRRPIPRLVFRSFRQARPARIPDPRLLEKYARAKPVITTFDR